MTGKKILSQLLAVAIIIIAFAFVARDLHSSWDSLADTISSPSLSFWAGCALILSMMALWPAIWIVIMRGCGAKMPSKSAYAIWWVSNLGKYVPGKVTLIAGRAWLARRWGPQVVLESFAWEFILSISSALIAGSLFLLYNDSIYQTIILGAALVSLFPLISPDLLQKVLRKPIALLGRGKWDAPVAMNRKTYLQALLMLVAGWIGWGVAHQLLLSGIGIEVDLIVLISVFSLAWAIGFAIIILPAGLGAREGALTQLMAPLAAAGVGAILALISRLVSIIAELIAFAIGSSIYATLSLEEE